jgi:hypothetical protein
MRDRLETTQGKAKSIWRTPVCAGRGCQRSFDRSSVEGDARHGRGPKCPGRLSSTAAVASAYRMSIPHGSCDTTLWSQLLKHDTPMFASHLCGDRLVFHFYETGTATPH